MNRRDSIRALAIGSISTGTVLSACNIPADKKNTEKATVVPEMYGRTPAEAAHDAELQADRFFTATEMETLEILCDIIIPADIHSGSATDAKVAAFIEFTMKDQPKMQVPMRGGLKWLDIKSFKLFNRSFVTAGKDDRLQLVELIAYPEKAVRENLPGVIFFNTVRNLTATGFFTSKTGIEDLQYKGNTPNEWDGVPDDVLKEYGLEYDEKILSQCLKNEDRGKMMIWND